MRNVKQEKGRGTKKRKRVPTVRRERKETIQIQQYQTRRKNILTGLNQVPVAGHPIFNTLQLQRQRLSSELQRQNLDIFTPKTHVEQQMYVDLSGSIKQEIESLGQLQQSEARDLLGRVADQVKSLENQYLSAEQKLCFRRSLAGEDLWITGAGGRGKSFLLQKIIQAMKQRGLNVLQVALTGIAAKNIDGITLHKFFRLPLELFTYTQQQLTAWTSKNAEQCSMLQELNVLIIDEVSMVSAYLFELIDRVLRGCCHVDRPFGGKQLIVMGDFFQLPTVKVMAQKANGGELRHSSKPLTADQFCFESKLWGRMFRMDNSIELMENFRQKDASFISFLDHFRVGRIDVAKLQTKYNEMVAYEKKMRLLKSNAETQQQALAQSLIDETLMSEGQIRVRLCPLLERVSRYNQDREKRVADYEPKIEKQIIRSRITFTEWDEKDRAKHKKITEWLRAVRDGNLPASHEQWMANVARMTERKQTKAELFKRCFIQTHHEDGNGTSGSKEQNLTCSKAPPLTLQIGSRVMLLRNLPSHGLVHGSCGFVRGFQPVVSHFIPGTTKTKKEKKKTKAKEKEKEKEEGYTWMCPIVIFDEKPEVFVVKPNRDLHMCKEGFLMIEQIPLNIAWALTIHKAQGLSLQHVDAEIARIFEHGQAYVALSRATTWEGLRIVNLDLNQCNKIDPKVIQYYRAMFPHNPLYAREQPSVSSAVDRKAQIQIQVKPLPLPLPIQIQIKPTQDELLMLRNLVGSSFSSLSSLATTSSRATSSSPLQQKKEDARPQKSEPPPAESKQQPIPIPVPSPSPLPLMSFTASNQDIDNAIAFGFGAFFIPHLNKRMAEFTL